MDWLKLAVRKLRSFWGLDRNSRWLLLQALLFFPLVTLSLKFGGLKRTQSDLVRMLPPGKIVLPDSELTSQRLRDRSCKIIKTISMVQLAARYCQPWAKCLQKSLVLWGLLRHQGINSELRIGVKRDAESFEAHAWVEYEGFVLNDTQNVRDRFAMFDRPIEVNFPSRES
ncbi:MULTISPECIES: lasso peptide biosynthesis B2 protein [unclassified Nodularia (in: cyanobacteria)]|uniref:lasso peptide biosynthesis B2 protein n=1 Tax=unclassified Nodularia (in: cyanobacteria) TaxID=2656917 RepID=UPI00187EBC15|nr:MULTISPECIES: lasso peptide biosynthesis B2 protein [unclassified Nodularia (in: cyanobacteria)]MBE9198371.1 lasso peptide biosynthesis B2 protein [Nodularia sp. LEGE 06071]MCC2691164.1 lasso peptide biosynthesis B2 protein [Nodularia sp. LEGE 04288]